jgi:hypothetical protein
MCQLFWAKLRACCWSPIIIIRLDWSSDNHADLRPEHNLLWSGLVGFNTESAHFQNQRHAQDVVRPSSLLSSTAKSSKTCLWDVLDRH